MTTELVGTALAYLLVGILLGILGPGRKEISDAVKHARGTTLTNTAVGRRSPSWLRLLLFRLGMTAIFALLWPIFTYMIMQERRQLAALEKVRADRSKGLWFYYMGGCGTLICLDCKHSESVTSFIHGIGSSSSGFQCQICGKLHSIKSKGRGRADRFERSLVCDCGGQLDRGKVLFCPSCKSRSLRYMLELIT